MILSAAAAPNAAPIDCLKKCRRLLSGVAAFIVSIWFLTQHKRWGMLKSDPDYLAIAKKVNRIDIYTEAAGALGISVPKDTMRSSKLMDGTVWDGKDPKAYAASFKIKA